MSVQSRLILSTLSMCNAFLLGAIGAGAVAYVDGAVRFPLAGAVWIFAVVLVRMARRLRRGVEWR